VVELPESTRTAAEAARAIGCELRQIVKSLVFRTAVSRKPVLVLASGSNRVDEAWMARYVGETLARADPEFVRSVAGYAIGGVPPSGHASTVPSYVDYDLLELKDVWAAAGHPQAVCRLTPGELLELTGGRPVPVSPTIQPETNALPWVTFDCYGTLVDWQTGILMQFKVAAGPSPPADEDRLFRAYVKEEMRLENGPYRPYRAVMTEALVRAAHAEGLSLAPAQVTEAASSIPAWPVFSDTRRALNALRARGFRIGVLSNIETDLLRRTMETVGVKPDCVVTAQEVQSYKPAFNHWIRFLRLTGADPRDVWHVSASFEHDIQPARSLGFRTAFIERYGKAPEGREVGLTAHNLEDFVQQLHPQKGGEPTRSAP
jgi:2-haloalkanoic acid dehalogenase type II